MTLHNNRSRQLHETLNGVNPSSSFRNMRSAKSGPNLWQIWQVFGPWASPYGANGQMTITVHNYRPRQFHRTSNRESPSCSYRDMSSASLAAAHPAARPAAPTMTTIPIQPKGWGVTKWVLKGNVFSFENTLSKFNSNTNSSYIWFGNDIGLSHFQCIEKNSLIFLKKWNSLIFPDLEIFVTKFPDFPDIPVLWAPMLWAEIAGMTCLDSFVATFHRVFTHPCFGLKLMV